MKAAQFLFSAVVALALFARVISFNAPAARLDAFLRRDLFATFAAGCAFASFAKDLPPKNTETTWSARDRSPRQQSDRWHTKSTEARKASLTNVLLWSGNRLVFYEERENPKPSRENAFCRVNFIMTRRTRNSELTVLEFR